ncbi:hypothetical protein [Acidimangrovimonas pyrenivorans]|uniref:Uncharacterized protein n=1 Tax=Acidimangrovimonas pyrenivorans TaxID=2030798 RepID=A0ABV7AC50_9RHOB
MEALCSTILEAEASASRLNDPEEQAVARAKGVRALWGLVHEADHGGMVSRHYSAKSEEGGRESEKRHRVECGARFLFDAREALSDSHLRRGTGAIAAYWVDMLTGAKPAELFPPTKRGSGNRRRSQLQWGAMREFVRLVHYFAGREGISFKDALLQLKPDASEDSFDKTQREYLSASDRQKARNAGKLVRRRALIAPEHAEDRDLCEHFLGDKARLADLIMRAYRH